MYPWRFSGALAIGFSRYFFDYVRVRIQRCLAIIMRLVSTQFMEKTMIEIGTQTDGLPEGNTCQQETAVEDNICDFVDSVSRQDLSQEPKYPDIKKSLQQVFDCVYYQSVLSWYNVPESKDNHPLYRALWREFDLAVDRITGRVSGVSIPAVSVGCIRILTQHLRDLKLPNRLPLFSSREDEVAVLRLFSGILVNSFLPSSLWGASLNQCVLNELVALNVLELLVNWLVDPDNLNQLVVSQLDATSQQGSVEDARKLGGSVTPPAEGSKDSDRITEGTEDIKTSPPRRKFKEWFKWKEWSKRFSKTKSKKRKIKADGNFFRALEIQSEPCEGSDVNPGKSAPVQSLWYSGVGDSDHESGPEDNQENMKYKVLYEMWRTGCWAATVTEVQEENEELCFVVHLEEVNDPENLQWEAWRTQADIRHFWSELQYAAELSSVRAVLESTDRTIDEEFKEEARVALQNFLQELVSDSKLCQTQAVFQFLSPMEWLLSEEEPLAGVWSFLSGLASFLTLPALEDDEDNSTQRPVKPDGLSSQTLDLQVKVGDRIADSGEESDCLEDCSEDNAQVDNMPVVAPSEGFPAASEANVTAFRDSSRDIVSADSLEGEAWACMENTQFRRGGGLEIESNETDRSAAAQSKLGRLKSRVRKAEEQPEQRPQKKGNIKSSREAPEATKAILDLLKEISGNSLRVNILASLMPLMKRKVNSFFANMNLTEAQVASYICSLQEKQWPGGVPVAPGPLRTSEEKSKTKDRAHQLFTAKYSNVFLWKSDVETVFKTFQDAEENKKLVYMLLSFIVRVLIPEEPDLNVRALASLNSPV